MNVKALGDALYRPKNTKILGEKLCYQQYKIMKNFT